VQVNEVVTLIKRRKLARLVGRTPHNSITRCLSAGAPHLCVIGLKQTCCATSLLHVRFFNKKRKLDNNVKKKRKQNNNVNEKHKLDNDFNK
jgi:hypothetical protein